jgi:hypothetical protein
MLWGVEERELANLQKEHRQMLKHRDLLKEHYKMERAERKHLSALLQSRDTSGQPNPSLGCVNLG